MKRTQQSCSTVIFLLCENISVFLVSDVIFFPHQMSRKQAIIMQAHIQCTRVQGTCSMTD